MFKKLHQISVKTLKTKYVGAVMMALNVSLLSACDINTLFSNPSGQPQRQNNLNPETVQNVTVQEVAQRTNDWVGKNVVVRSQLVQKVGGTVFTINDNQLFGSEPILVVNYTGKPVTLPPGQPQVQVTGTVAKFIIPELQRDFDLKLDPAIYKGYEGKPVIIAQSIAVVR